MLPSPRQWLARWRSPGLATSAVVERILRDTKLAEADRGAVTALVGAGSGVASVSLVDQSDAMTRIVLALAQQRPLMIAIEDAELLDVACVYAHVA